MMKTTTLLLWVGLLAIGSAQDINEECLTCKSFSYEEPCSLFLAPSTIPGAGWGVYTAVDLKEGDSIGEDDYIIPILDKFKTLPYRGQQQFLSWLGYVWPAYPDYFYSATKDSFPTIPQAMYKVDPGLNGATSLKFRDEDNNRVSAFAPGIASLVNSGGPHLVNIKSVKKKRQISFVARHNVKAGSELFLHYGDIWHKRLEKRQKSEVEYDNLDDYNRGILSNMTLPTEQDKRNKLTQKKRKQLEMDDDDEFPDGSFYNAVEGIKKYIDDILGKSKSSDMNFVYDSSNVDNKEEDVEQEIPKQDLDWLKEHGMCINNLKSGPSKKRGAARFSNRRGAFAKKHIPNGERIAPAPLLALKRDDLNIYKADESKEVFGEVLNMNEVEDEEELLNFCFGHEDSELLLVPVSPVVNFINHGGRKPNAEIRWPKDSANEWLEMHPLDVLDLSGKIIAEFVALRDIEPDEEIVIDFGEDWDEEWWDHQEEYDDMTEFRHEIGVPDGFFPDNWLNETVVYELAMKPLKPGELELMRWKHNGKPICKNCYRVGMPPKLTQHIRDFADERGITKLYEKLLYNNILDTNEWTTFETHQEQWFAQQYEAKAWKFNMHYVAAWDEAARQSFLRALGIGGFDLVLESLGTAYGLENMTCFHLSFMGVSEADNSFTHTDVYASGEKAFNFLWPMLLVNGSSPELDIVSDDTNIVLSVNYDYDAVYALGDWGYHKTSPNRYKERGQMRITMNAYCSQIDDSNAKMMHYIYDGEDPAPFCGQFYGEREAHWSKYGDRLPK